MTEISIVGAVALLVTYGVWLLDYLRSDRRATAPRAGAAASRSGLALALLGVGGVGAAFVSDWFIAALTPAMEQVGIPKAFAGLVIVAIAGNAVENTTGIVLALKGKADLAISVVKNSVAQIAAFLFPALVLVSLVFDDAADVRARARLHRRAALTALAIWQITGDGEARRSRASR